ncbi:MAG: metal ABC transporter permease [Turicibacter sp.]|nr:metal ABC transporter permease [Turicibacter sp.]
MISSGIISVACFFIGMTVSFLYSTPAGASVVLVNAVAFLIFSVIGMVTKRV